MKLRGTEIALIGIMASLIVASGYVPIIPIVGTGYSISLGSVLIQIVAVILGPLLGVLAVLVGSFSGMVLTGQGIQFLFFIPATVGALTTALLVFGKAREALLVILCTLAFWYVSPYGVELWYYPYMLIGVCVIIAAMSPLLKGLKIRESRYQYPLLVLFCTAGVLCDQLLGSTIAIFPPFELPSGAYKAILYIYPIERMAISLVSATVAVPVLRALGQSNISILDEGRTVSRESPIEDTGSRL
ncbi:MAG TPA: ECF transporter S component [Candidatus Methanofastidiosa archaeon]|nr:ECF transporter S component [Candidatus Methanofastidiosa archaeon]HPR42192.1 ECF transporter S component [Candidatus Methanofastidiosa archaeon]